LYTRQLCRVSRITLRLFQRRFDPLQLEIDSIEHSKVMTEGSALANVSKP